MMNDSQHQDAVEFPFGPFEQTGAFAILPPHRRGWTGKISNHGLDRQTVADCSMPIEISGLYIGIPGNYVGAALSSDARVNPRIGADIKYLRRPNAIQRTADKCLFGLVIRGFVVAGGLGVRAPSRSTRRRGKRIKQFAR